MQVAQTLDPRGKLSQTFHVPRLINDAPLLTGTILKTPVRTMLGHYHFSRELVTASACIEV